MASSHAIVVDQVSRRFRMYTEKHQSLKETILRRSRGTSTDFWALRDVSFSVDHGESLGLVGHNGSGKSTMLKIITGVLPPTSGRVDVVGRISSLLELGAGFHPELSGRENVYLTGTFAGFTRKQITQRMDSIVDFAGNEEFMDQPVKRYSSGMYARLGFSIAIHVDPDVLIVDEVLAVGDEEFQRRCLERIVELRQDGRTIVFVSHALGTVLNLCERAVWLDHGVVREVGPVADVVERYRGLMVEAANEHAAAADAARNQHHWIHAVQVLDEQGGPTKVLRTGDGVRLRITWDAPRAVDEPLLAIAIDRHDGVNVYATGTNLLRHDFSMPRGDGVIDFVIPQLDLLPGNYTVSVAVAEFAGQRWLSERRPACHLMVMGGVDPRSEGVFTPRGHWEDMVAAEGLDRSRGTT